MRNALGRVLSAAVLVSSFGAPIPAFSENLPGAAESPTEPIPSVVETGIALSSESEVATQPRDIETATLSSQVAKDYEAVEPSVVDFGSTAREEERLAENKPELSSVDTQSVTVSEPNGAEIGAVSREIGGIDSAKTVSADNNVADTDLKGADEQKTVDADKSVVADDASKVDENKTESETTAYEAGSVNNGSKVEEVASPEAGENSPENSGTAEDVNKAADGTQAEGAVVEKSESDSSEVVDNKGPQSPMFSGTVEGITDKSLRVAGLSASGEPLSLDFNLDSDSQLAEDMKIGDSVTVFYDVDESGSYRVVSARYFAGDPPKNVFPGDIAGSGHKVSENDGEGTGTKTGEVAEGQGGQVQGEADGQDQNTEGVDSDQEAPNIASIEIEGNETVPTADIMQLISTRVGEPLKDPRIRRDMQAIYDSGYYVDVRPYIKTTSDGEVRVIFKVWENPVVNEIALEGNKIAETDKLRSLMQLETGKVLNTQVLRNDIQAINKYYNEELGYTISPSHVSKLALDENGRLAITLVDGIVISEIKVEGVTVFPQEQVDSLVTLKPGDLFNRNTLRQDTDKIIALYEDKGYVLDTVKPTVNAETGTVTIQVAEAVLKDIELVWNDSKGKHRTKDETVLRNIRTKRGAVISRDRLEKDMKRLDSLGLFKKIEPETKPGGEPGQVILVLNIEEQKTGMATVGVGYAGGGSGAIRPGITGAISYSERNLFGTGRQISVNLQRGSQIGAYGISYLNPAINENQDSFGISVYYNNVDEVEQQVSGAEAGVYSYYDQEVYGVTATYGHPFSDDFTGYVTLRHDTINMTMSKKSEYVPVGIGKGDLNAIGLAAIYDTRRGEDILDPHEGTYGNIAFTFAGLGGDYDYSKLVVEARHYVPITKRTTLALRGLYGTVGNGAPASEYFYAGGSDTLRGYDDNSMFGNKIVLFNAEYRFPIFSMVNGAVFFDAGNAWISGYNSDEIRTDAGIGLRIKFPNLGLGIIRIDQAFGKDGSRTSIGIGQSF